MSRQPGGAGVFDQLPFVEPDHRLVLVEDDDVLRDEGVVVNVGARRHAERRWYSAPAQCRKYRRQRAWSNMQLRLRPSFSSFMCRALAWQEQTHDLAAVRSVGAWTRGHEQEVTGLVSSTSSVAGGRACPSTQERRAVHLVCFYLHTDSRRKSRTTHGFS